MFSNCAFPGHKWMGHGPPSIPIDHTVSQCIALTTRHRRRLIFNTLQGTWHNGNGIVQKVLPREWLTPGPQSFSEYLWIVLGALSILYSSPVLSISCIDALLCVLVGSKRTNCLRGGGLTGQEPVKESRKAKNSHCGMILGKHSFPIYSSMAPSLVLSEILFMFRSWMMTSCKWDLLLYCWLLPAEDDRGRRTYIWKPTCGWGDR